MIRKKIQIIFCWCFFIVVFLPILFINRDKNAISVIENKKLAPFPEFSRKDILNKKFIAGIENYFNDNIGFRKMIILNNIKYMYLLFGKIDVPAHIKGKDGHVFYMHDGIIKIYQGIDYDNEEQIKKISNKLHELNNSIEQLGSKFIFCPIPNKEQIYSEYVPRGINRINNNSMLEALAYDVKQNKKVKCVNMYDILARKKKEINKCDDYLYYKNIDASHWNHYGAYWGYKAICDEIAIISPDVKPIPLQDVHIEGHKVKKAILYLQQYPEVSHSFNLEDIVYCYNRKFTGVLDNTTPEVFSMNNDKTNNYFHYINENINNKTTILVMGDSYIWTFMLPLLAESFSDVYFLSNGVDAQTVRELYDLVKPQIVLFEIVARMTNAVALDLRINDLNIIMKQ